MSNLENKIKNFGEEIECLKKQLFANQNILQKNNIQQKNLVNANTPKES